MSRISAAALAACVAMALACVPAIATAQTTIASSRSSWVDANTVGSRTDIMNTFTGVSSGEEYRSFIEFAVPANAVPYSSATLRLNTAGVLNAPITLTVYDLLSDLSTAPVGTIYDDAGTGTVLGSISGVTASYSIIEITLNAAGLAAVNTSRGGNIAFGFVATPNDGSERQVFSSSSASTLRTLVLTAPSAPTPVPTMTEWAMILLGVMLAGGAALTIHSRRTV